MGRRLWAAVLGIAWVVTGVWAAEDGRLGPDEDRFKQEQFDRADLDLRTVRAAGLVMFATPFNHADGYGDGPVNPLDLTSPGGRPTLGNNGTFLRVNGLDGQTCVDCHALVSTRTVPPSFGVGGFGGLNNAPIFQPTVIDVSDTAESGFAFLDGRLIVPPHLFGAGAVQLLAEEMSRELRDIGDQAISNPGQALPLVTKGVSFGVALADADGDLDESLIEGVDSDLVVRPFGRKGEFPTVRAFDEEAMRFHFGMEPVEAVGVDVDADGDGVVNEALVGEMSALEIFLTTMDRPHQEVMSADAVSGFVLFNQAGCSDCHRPALNTLNSRLDYRLSDDEAAYFSVDLSHGLTRFARDAQGGLIVPLFSDLKRHDMGPGLAENFQGADARINSEFITVKLWGVADSAPYLHDGRALTLDEAIRWHGGEAQSARDAYVGMSNGARRAIIAFLETLRLPRHPNADVID
ncbi:MAG: di-heme oxidoredictase family protein [Xanthomonadales bacterium]|nr:di-heme oxidoredictase family protein [Xanthomonadales bacterium]